MRPRVRQPAGFTRDHFHGRYICNRCSAEVHDWQVHANFHAELDTAQSEREEVAYGPDDLAAAANAEGRAVHSEFRSTWREAWRQVAACLRLTPPKDTRPAATDDPPGAAGRAEQWAAMSDLIKRTTEA